MARKRDAVLDAIRRWQEQGLVTGELAAELRAEVIQASGSDGRRWVQYIIAATAAVVTVIAAGVFLSWSWPIVGAGVRTLILGGAGIALVALGAAMQARDRWIPAAVLLQTAGLAVLFFSLAYSENAWGDASPGGIAVGFLALATTLVLAATTDSDAAFMPAVHTAFGFGFLFLFLRRATTLDTDVIIWILDAVLALALVVLTVRLLHAARTRVPEAAISAFAASVYVGMVLVLATMVGPLETSDGAAYALDVWLALVTGVTLWAIHRAPQGLRRPWYHYQLAACVVLAALLAFWTGLGALDTSELVTAMLVALVGVAGLGYSLARDVREVVIASCLVVLIAAWYFGATQGGALGAVLALAFSAGLLFWISAQLGRGKDGKARPASARGG